MFQTFDEKTVSETSKNRIYLLREEMRKKNIDAFLIPRNDAHMGEYVSDRDKRLEWLTSFSGSAGYCIVFKDKAFLFVDGRYTIQAENQCDENIFEIRNIPKNSLIDCINESFEEKALIAYDPWLHTIEQILEIHSNKKKNIELIEVDNFIDTIWIDQPIASVELMVPHLLKYSGQVHTEKLEIIGNILSNVGQSNVILTQPDTIAWALNTRGTDLIQTPVALCFATINASGSANLFIDPKKVDDELRKHLGPNVVLHDIKSFSLFLKTLSGLVRIDSNRAPIAIKHILEIAKVSFTYDSDPILKLRACKNKTELEGSVQAHIRDGAAVVEFLSEIQYAQPGFLKNEIELVKLLESKRYATGKLKNISFDTICGSGPNAAIIHYRVNTKTNRTISLGDVVLIDSGGQYLDGTTDITRTIAIGSVAEEVIDANTLVLKGMIAISALRFPKGLSGRDIDSIARQALWSKGLDFDHGTGHGVGSFLSVHEGPQAISRHNNVPLEPGMIISNEPGYYKKNSFGIRIENLIYVKECLRDKNHDDRCMLEFETLTLAPFDLNMIKVSSLNEQEIKWLNNYHSNVYKKLNSILTKSAKKWLKAACIPI
ncbi:aminopeptidase P family protein [Amylibacter sp.]|jgi:Xaa-Pro aminopeptidase|nr:aminopeptidase P family protein [Rhodobacterales bacterium]MDB4110427.1 aminopeptidase P family protein [Amylibacter sp.]MBT4470129.1 aminopeptidase P family protein [Rhodobacterales bacterium]MBT6833866.1 aminopeptidase P family protein [Rhodobacterales bacterium]MBT6894353.1 aminopeptidase P family protein [Rhodobacterales bacterium]